MTPETVKAMLYGGLKEMTEDRKLFRKSDIGRKHEYSGWTDEGEIAVKGFVELMTTQMLIAEDAKIEDKAKDMVMSNLKK